MDDFIAKWVEPFYLNGLMGSDAAEIRAALLEMDETIIARLLSTLGWRERIVGSWFCGLKRWNHFEDVIGPMFLASEVVYAGRGHAFALACFSDEPSRNYLIDYLDYYLTQPEKFYDQHWAMPALMWIDEQHGTNYSALYLTPDGLWEAFTRGKNEAWQIKSCKDRFWHLMYYCQHQFGTP